MVNYKKMFDAWSPVSNSVRPLQSFANGILSGNALRRYFANTIAGGEVRNMLLAYKVKKARQLVRKALRRRGIAV